MDIVLTHENFVSIARDLIEITDKILKEVVRDTEQAAIEIGDKIQEISYLTSEQTDTLRNIMESIHTQGTLEHEEIEQDVKDTASFVDQIFERAQEGNFEEACRIGDDPKYRKLKQKTGKLVKQLEQLTEQDKHLAEIVAPVLMALQFQDRIRQSLENVIKTFNVFFSIMSSIRHEKLPEGFASSFWEQVENQFTSNKDRNVVRRIVFGDEYQEEDVVEEGGSLFF